MTLIGSADDGMDRPTRVASLVGRLTELLPHLSFSSSLFVPGALPTRVDHDYLASLMSPEELEEVFARRREAVRTAPLPG